MCVGISMHSTHVEVRGQLMAVDSFLTPCRFQGFRKVVRLVKCLHLLSHCACPNWRTFIQDSYDFPFSLLFLVATCFLGCCLMFDRESALGNSILETAEATLVWASMFPDCTCVFVFSWQWEHAQSNQSLNENCLLEVHLSTTKTPCQPEDWSVATNAHRNIL